MEDETPKRNYIVKEASKATGYSERTIYAVMTKMRRHRTLSMPGIAKTKKSGLLRIVHTSLFANIAPTLNAIIANVNSDESLPDFSRSTLHRLLHGTGFDFLRRGNKAAFIECDVIVRRRHTYLREVKWFRVLGKPVIYTDESWVNVGLSVGKAWKATTVKSARQAAIESLSSGLKPHTGRGTHFALVYAGNENSFVQNAVPTFLYKKCIADAPNEMIADGYEKWFSEQLLPS
ncbi:hypothetical protein PR048_023253 [Dryococelus australis]|uniref:Uncharacterized protein n=1 Tax=Dryococelus australis TaxID=614101 RepID=A0ABQ9GTN3_9NEOP|nr:hypothetical protein PR048_023253 [Dryococelus australis]